jgi:transcriptional regulator with XRE-family HTH domain
MVADPVAARIKELRENQRLSQEDLSDRAGLARWKLASIETGRRRVSSTEVVLFAEALGTNADDLLGMGVAARHYRTNDLGSPAVRAGLDRFDAYISASLRLRDLERFVGEA